MHGIDQELFEHTGQEEACPKCGAALHVRRGKHGPFVGCSGYPECDYIKPNKSAETSVKQILPDIHCPQCNSELALKQGKFGLFVGCMAYPECDFHQQLDTPEETQIACPQCTEGTLVERTSRYGKIFYACDQYPKCQFAVNHAPHAGTCNKCGFGLLLERKLAAGIKLQCANKKCGEYQS